MEDLVIIALKERMEEMEKILRRIEQGIFGDDQLQLPGLLRTQKVQQDQIDALKIKIEELEKVNEKQDVAIKAKKGLTDNAVKWLTRSFWFVALITALILLITGKIGIADLINLK